MEEQRVKSKRIEEKKGKNEGKKRRRIKEEKVRRIKKIQGRKKVGKSRHTVLFQWLVAPEGEKPQAVLARNTCPSQTVQNTAVSEHFAKLRCRKNARGCGAKHLSKSKYAKHPSLGPLLEVEMSKKCRWLRRENQIQLEMCKTHHVQTTFGIWDVQVKTYKKH